MTLSYKACQHARLMSEETKKSRLIADTNVASWILVKLKTTIFIFAPNINLKVPLIQEHMDLKPRPIMMDPRLKTS